MEKIVLGKDLIFLFSPEDIDEFIKRVLRIWNIQYTYNRSCGNSWYITMWLGMPYQAKAGRIRTSDHDGVRESSRYDFDVVSWAARDGAHGIKPVTYPKLLKKLAVQLGRELPKECLALLEHSKEHAIQLQHNRRHRAWRPSIKRAKHFLNAG